MAEEKSFENKVKKFLTEEGVWFVKTWSNGVQRSGIPDILACVNGFFVGIEVKASKGKPSELQIFNLRNINKSHGYGILLYPDDFPMFQELVWQLKEWDWIDAMNIADDINKTHDLEL